MMIVPQKFLLPALAAICLHAGPMAAQSPRPAGDNSWQASAKRGDYEPLTDPGLIYNDKQPTRWVGQAVTLKNVTVQDTNDSGNFWVGSDGGHRLLVVKPESNLDLHSMRLHKGDIVTISGTVRAASDYMATKTGAERGSMHDAKDSSKVFLLADNINITSSTQH